MGEKRFTYMEQFNGFCDVYDDGKVLSCMRLEYVEKTVKLLNELNEENKELKQQLESEHTMLDNAILLERTRMGKNSLIQYREAIQ